MGHLINLWCLLTKSTTLEILLALKHKNEITKIKNQTSVEWVKRAIGLKTCFGGAFDKLLVFVDQKYHTWDTFGAKTQRRLQRSKTKLAFLLGLKRAIGLKTCFGGAFDKLLVFVDQKYHTWDTLGAKTQKGDYEDQEPNLRFFWSKHEQLSLKLVLVGHLTNFWCLLTKSTKLEILLALKH